MLPDHRTGSGFGVRGRWVRYGKCDPPTSCAPLSNACTCTVDLERAPSAITGISPPVHTKDTVTKAPSSSESAILTNYKEVLIWTHCTVTFYKTWAWTRFFSIILLHFSLQLPHGWCIKWYLLCSNKWS